ncbi:MAG: hypothetical protein WDO73_33090 [Ignavibacteriota bacterium]
MKHGKESARFAFYLLFGVCASAVFGQTGGLAPVISRTASHAVDLPAQIAPSSLDPTDPASRYYEAR